MPELRSLKETINQKFKQKFNRNAEFVSAAPGRINIIGEHTDYNFGLSMPAAINRWVIISAAFRNDNQIRIASESFNSEMSYEPGKTFNPEESWQKYIFGALEIFQRTDKITKGFDAFIWGNVPLGSGVSSSAAIEVAIMNLLRVAFSSTIDDLNLVKNCQKIEHEYLGVKSGLLDQYASQFSKEGKLMILDFQKLSHEYADGEMGEWCWVLANTKVKRELAGSKYSERVEETKKALEIIQKADASVKHFRDVEAKHLNHITDPILKKRLKHFVEEDQRVFDTVSEFKKKNMKGVGELLLASHYSLQNDYEVSCPELDFLVEEAKKFEGCAGGRMMGGGFGGCTINLLKKDKLNEFTNAMSKAYKTKFNIDTEIYAFDSVDGAKCDKVV